MPAYVVGATGTPSGRGYWLISADGGGFDFGDARFKGASAREHQSNENRREAVST